MQDRMTIDELVAMQGKAVYATDGDKIGEIERVFYDTDSGEPEWVGVNSGGLFGSKHVLVPVQGAQRSTGDNEGLRVSYPKDLVKDAPAIDRDEISEDEEQQLYAHYGLQTTDYRSDTQLPQEQINEGPAIANEDLASGASGNFATSGDTLSRHEEELHIGKRDIERPVRLRKWVETQPVSEQATLHRETAFVEREAVDRPAPGAQIGEQEIETTLHEEEPFLQKETVEKERVRLGREEQEEQQAVQGEVRREHVEAEGDIDEDEDRGDELRRAS